MRRKTTNRSPHKGKQRSGEETGDLFAVQLAGAVAQAFALPAEEGSPAVSASSPPLATSGGVTFASVASSDPKQATAPCDEPLPARMLNEFVYCPRLFYYEHVEGVFVESADTMRGAAVHARVDKGSGTMPKTAKRKAPTDKGRNPSDATGKVDQPAHDPGTGEIPAANDQRDEIHSRSVTLGSERLGVIAKMDLVEAALDAEGGAISVRPVDYKVGSPRAGEDGATLWDADKMQLGVQCLVLRDNGFPCDEGIIYYRGTRQRVPLAVTSELETWILEQIAAARVTACGTIPPPLIDSPKCARCSLAPVCLPDETRMLSLRSIDSSGSVDGRSSMVASSQTPPPFTIHQSPSTPLEPQAPPRLIASRDERRALYLNTQGYRIGCNDGVLKVKEKDRVVEEVRVNDVCHVALFGNIQISTQAVQTLCDRDVPITYFSMGGWFYGITRGHSLTNVLVRIAQFRHAADPASCLRLARQFVRGKIHNQRVLFMRNHIEPPERTKLRLGQAREDLDRAHSLETLLGMEGAAAAEYFAQFAGLLRTRDDVNPESADETVARFDFTTRNRRPPTDPVNALLSLAYSLLAKECTLAAAAVGLDPYVGFYHQPRHGRPALALDLMEEFRPIIADSAVITAINNRFVSPADFVTAGRAVNLNSAGRKQFFQCFEQRMNALVTHPIFDYKVSYRRALELQFRILARVLTGEIPEYTPFLTR